MKKRIIALLIGMVLLLGLCGCQKQLQQAFEETGLQEPAQAMVDALLRDDYEAAKALLAPQLHGEFTQETHDTIRNALEGVGEKYTMTPVYVNQKVSGGVTQTSLRLELRSGERMWYVEAVKVSDTEGLAGFSVTPHQETTVTGTFATIAQSDPVQWIFLIVSLAEMAFVVWMAIDCIRHKTDGQWLWLALILMGNLILSLNVTEGGFQMNYQVGIFLSYTALLRYSTGGFMVRLFLPVGTIAFFALRKKIRIDESKTPESIQNGGE